MLRYLLMLLFLLGGAFTSVTDVYGDAPPASTQQPKKVVYFIQGHWGNFFDSNNLVPMRQAGYDLGPMLRFHQKATEAGYDLRIAERDALSLTDVTHQPIEEFEYLIVFEVFPHQLHYLSQHPKEKLILFLWEPPSVIPESYFPENHQLFSKVYTWRDDLIDNKKYFKLYYPVLHPMQTDGMDFDIKKLCTLLASNRQSATPNELYSERRNVIDFYEKNHRADFDFYGRGWPSDYKTYRGPAGDKNALLKFYKFCYSYENIKGVPGYITEKIFDCFQAGCVPIYWGAPNIDKYMPKGCYIDREAFANDEELYQYINTMKEDTYKEYLQNIQKFLNSEQAQVFSSDHFVTMMMDLINMPSPVVVEKDSK